MIHPEVRNFAIAMLEYLDGKEDGRFTLNAGLCLNFSYYTGHKYEMFEQYLKPLIEEEAEKNGTTARLPFNEDSYSYREEVLYERVYENPRRMDFLRWLAADEE